jgi:lysozyme family protein
MKELKAKLARLNRFDGFTFKIKESYENYSLIKSFHNVSKNAKYNRFYDETLVDAVDLDVMHLIIDALIKDHENVVI